MHRGLIFIHVPINTRRCIHKLNFYRNSFLRFVHDELLRHEVFYAYSRKHRIDRELLHRWVMWSMDLLFKLSSFYSYKLYETLKTNWTENEKMGMDSTCSAKIVMLTKHYSFNGGILDKIILVLGKNTVKKINGASYKFPWGEKYIFV